MAEKYEVLLRERLEVYLQPTMLHQSFLEPAPQNILKGPGSNLRQSNAASSSWILPNLNITFSLQLWECWAPERTAQRVISKTNAFLTLYSLRPGAAIIVMKS